MKIRCIIITALISMSFFKLSLIHAQESKTSFIVNERKINIDSLETQIKFLMDEVGIAGLSFAVIDEKKEVYYNSFGYKRIEENQKNMIDKETVFEACSLSKSFVVYAAYQMLNKGVLDFDKPLYEYLEYNPLEYDERYKSITARMVLSHISGIENHLVKNDPDVLEIVAQPGQKFVYSGEGYIYLSKVIEKLLNKPVEKYMTELIYTPLGLNRTFTTFTDLNDKGKGNYATGHNVFGQEFVKLKNKKPDLAARIHTNARDYAKLMISLFENKNLSSQRLLDPVTKIRDDIDLYYGPGFEVYFTPTDTLLFQGGNNDGYKALACYSLAKKSGYVFFANSDRSDKISEILSKLTIGIDLKPYFDIVYNNQYPNTANTVFSIYKKKGLEAMQNKLDYYLTNEESHLTDKDVVELVYYFKDKEYETVKNMADKYCEIHPDSDIDFIYKRWLNK